ncbi:MAG: zinc ribbon domain-containing protein [Chromatiaceae bacterium]|nr:MAG: zinc ribbon domain-containing protein [Chromatiaceae bacterium]
MALIECPECGREVSDKAPTCPGCGAPIAAQEHMEVREQEPGMEYEQDVDEEWVRGEQEYMAFTDRVARHRVMSVLLFFGGLTLGMGMKAWVGQEGDGRALIYYVADLMVWGGIIWLVVNEARNLWFHRKLGG